MKMETGGRWLTLVGIGLLFGLANPGVQAREKREQAHALTQSYGFLSAHPDLRWRTEGVQSYEQGRYEEAMTRFKRASHYADKPSQAVVAEMYWRGLGVAADRALAYAWMDLASERSYKDLLARREGYWQALSEDERTRALQQGASIYAEYGDDVAKPRIEAVLRRARSKSTGSRLGAVDAVGALRIWISDGAGGMLEVDSSQYYASKYWKPEEYFTWQEKTWVDLPRGQVEVGELESSGRTRTTE